MKKRMFLLALLGGALLAQNRPLANGLYAVEEGSSKAASLVTRQVEGKNIVLDTANSVPLVVEGKPEVNRDAQGSWLEIRLAPEAAKRLADFTQSHMNRQIAVVIGDKILSTPTVRSVIKDGKARVTPCEDESCEALIQELRK
jgi:preprotein translocase subunit SecD